MRGTSRRALAAVAAMVVAGGAAVATRQAVGQITDTLTERLIKFRVTGAFRSFDPATGDAVFVFSGPFYATTVNQTTGVVSDVPGIHLGEVRNATVHFRFDLAKGVLSSDTARFSCEACRFEFDDGSVLEPLLDDPSTPQPEQDIPMDGRLLFDLGPVPGGDPSAHRIRGIGCGGAKETAGKGALANTKGAVCVNGTFAFSMDPASITNPSQLLTLTGTGESNCTLVLHLPPPGF